MDIYACRLAAICIALTVASVPAKANEAMGGFLGAIAGGILGNQIGEGSGRIIATGIGAMIGAQAGSSIGRSMEYGYVPRGYGSYDYGYRSTYGYSYAARHSFNRAPSYRNAWAYGWSGHYGTHHRYTNIYAPRYFGVSAYRSQRRSDRYDHSPYRSVANIPSQYYRGNQTETASASLYRRDVPGVIGAEQPANSQGYATGPSNSIYVTPYGYPVQ